MRAANLTLDGIHAILFDLDGTLRHSRPSYNHTFFVLADQLGVSGSDAARRRATRWAHYYWAGSPELADDLQTFEENKDLFFANYLQRQLIAYGAAPERAAVLAPELYCHIEELHRPEDWVPPDAPETLRALKKAGFTLGVVSNRQEPFQDVLDRLGLGPYFAFALAAGEVNSYKPDGVIFQHAVQRAGTCAECTMYVGDNYYADIVGAQRAGLRPVLLDPEGIFPGAECPVIRSLGELQGEIT